MKNIKTDNPENAPLKPGLYCVATPIGHLQDITFRAIDTLNRADVIACEDTRTSQKLLSHYGIKGCTWPYHDHNAAGMRPKIIQAIQQGKVVALISDAGTPLINDPGVKLVKECQQLGLYITTLPGPCSVTSALVLSGLSSHSFAFGGFFQEKRARQWQNLDATLLFFEGPHRLHDTLTVMQPIFKNRPVAIVREITKYFEQVIKGSFEEILHHVETHTVKGEIVIVLGAPVETTCLETVTAELSMALTKMSFKEAVEMISTLYPQISKKDIYRLGLGLKGE